MITVPMINRLHNVLKNLCRDLSIKTRRVGLCVKSWSIICVCRCVGFWLLFWFSSFAMFWIFFASPCNVFLLIILISPISYPVLSHIQQSDQLSPLVNTSSSSLKLSVLILFSVPHNVNFPCCSVYVLCSLMTFIVCLLPCHTFICIIFFSY